MTTWHEVPVVHANPQRWVKLFFQSFQDVVDDKIKVGVMVIASAGINSFVLDSVGCRLLVKSRMVVKTIIKPAAETTVATRTVSLSFPLTSKLEFQTRARCTHTVPLNFRLFRTCHLHKSARLQSLAGTLFCCMCHFCRCYFCCRSCCYRHKIRKVTRRYSSFSQSHKVGSVGIIANFVFPHISSFHL